MSLSEIEMSLGEILMSLGEIGDLALALHQAALADHGPDPAGWGRRIEEAHTDLARRLSVRDLCSEILLGPGEHWPYLAPDEGEGGRMDAFGAWRVWPPPPLALPALTEGTAPDDEMGAYVTLAYYRAMRWAALVKSRCDEVHRSITPSISPVRPGVFSVTIGPWPLRTVELIDQRSGKPNKQAEALDELLSGQLVDMDDHIRRRLLVTIPELGKYLIPEQDQYRLLECVLFQDKAHQ